MLVLVITKPLLTARVGMTTSFYTPLIILSSGSNGKVCIFLYYLAVWVEDKRLHLSFNNEVWQRLPISVPWIYRVHSILMIGITGSLDCVPLVHPLPFWVLAGRDGSVYCMCHFYFTAIFHRASKKSLGFLHCRQFSRFHL